MKQFVGMLVLMLALGASMRAQDESPDFRTNEIDQILELISENLESEDIDFTTLLADLQYHLRHPLNLNRAGREDLQRLVVLNDFQIESLLSHRAQTGPLTAIYELQGVQGFDLRLIQAMLPFVKVTDSRDQPRFSWRELREEGTHEAFIRYQRVLEEMEGYAPIADSALAASPNARYVGSPARIFTRYRFRYGKHLSAGVTAEKDAGEQFFGSTQPSGFDFYSAHAYLGEYGPVKHAIIGDYQVQFGQGLTFWTGLAFGKSANIASIKRTARTITPFVSAEENNFMRGAATTVALGKFEVTAFYSNKRVDANLIAADTLDDEQISASTFSSLQSSGFHRTPGELADKDAITEMNTGGHVRYIRDRFQLGGTVAYTKLGGDFQQPEALYRQFEPIGNPYVVAGFDYQLMVRNVLAFGEVAQRMDGGTAFLNGAIISLDPKFDISLLHRHYDAAYHNPRSNAISESSRNTNEEGLYLGYEATFSRKWRMTGYIDLFQFNWMRFQAKAPTDGHEWLSQLEFRPKRGFTAYLRYRIETKSEGYDLGLQPTDQMGDHTRQWVRLNWQYALNKQLTLRNRLEFVHVSLPEGHRETGWLIYQDVVFKPAFPSKWQFKLRYALFDTDGYDSRIYAYEHDVLYSFSVPAYYHRGSRGYLIVGYDLFRGADLTLRLAQTYYQNRQTSGSGLNVIDGATRTEVKLQLRVRI